MAFSVFFDARDHQLVRTVNEFLNRGVDEAAKMFHIPPALHPNGILQMTSLRVSRVAWALMLLLNTSERSTAESRLEALTRLHEETQAFAQTAFRYNTARVLVQIMKDILRNRDNVGIQLGLAHDFYRAATGKPRIVRSMLKRYYLVEMPEDFSQRAFDHYVHDAYTSGRKSPTHLIMDAWVKGINNLTVIYKYRIYRDGAQELAKAAEIMGINLRLGVKFTRLWRGAPVNVVWIPRGFSGGEGFFKFLEQPAMKKMAEKGDAIFQKQWKAYGPLIDSYNERYRPALNTRFGINVPPLSWEEFGSYVSPLYPSRIRFAECIHARTVQTMKSMEPLWREAYAAAAPKERQAMRDAMIEKNAFSPMSVLREWLDEAYAASGIELIGIPRVKEKEEAPGKHLDTRELPGLLQELSRLSSDSRIALAAEDLAPASILQILYECGGLITHLEIEHPTNWSPQRLKAISEISTIQDNINAGNPVSLKYTILHHIESCQENDPDWTCMHNMLHNLPSFMRRYHERPLGIFLGSGSSGRSQWGKQYGMGFALLETLPYRARKQQKGNKGRPLLPLRYGIAKREERIYPAEDASGPGMSFLKRRMPLITSLFGRRKVSWMPHLEDVEVTKNGNVLALGGYVAFQGNMLSLIPPETNQSPPHRLTDLNTSVYNLTVLLIGFIPTAATFWITQDGLMQYLGAPVWFAITGLRNIIQAMISGGWLYRASRLRWMSYVSWTRVCESLLYSGLSTPLLELLVRLMLLKNMLGLTADNSPVIVFVVIAAVNGVYIAAQMLFRGLPPKSAYTNSVRNIVAIPLVLVYNSAFGAFLSLIGLSAEAVGTIITNMATVVSKTASDTMGGLIGGYFDRKNMLRLRFNDYHNKLRKLDECQIRLELLFPYEDSLHVLLNPVKLLTSTRKSVRELGKALSLHALDLMYFWYYQPLAILAAKRITRRLSDQERFAFVRFQFILEAHEQISQFILSGVLGKKFQWALSFYLDTSSRYLTQIRSRLLDPRARSQAFGQIRAEKALVASDAVTMPAAPEQEDKGSAGKAS